MSSSTLSPLSAIFVLNLQRRKDRLRRVQQSHRTSTFSHIPLVQFVAVDGTTTDLNVLLTTTAKDELARLEDVGGTGMRGHHSQLTRGAIGCYLTHVSVWERVAAMPGPCLIVEDDIEFPQGPSGLTDVSNAIKVAAKAQKNKPDQPWMLSFHCTCHEGCWTHADGLARPQQFWSTAAYVLTPASATELLGLFRTAMFPIDVQIDAKLCELVQAHRLTVYAIPLFTVGDAGTDIQHQNCVSGCPLTRPAVPTVRSRTVPVPSPGGRCSIL